MTRTQLEHAIRAACEVSRDNELWVFGSQAILGHYPEAPHSVCASIEVDVQPKNRPDAVDSIDGALGELSQFHHTHGFYVHGVSVETARLPQGWQQRAKPVRDPVTTRGNTGWCVDAHDLTASKLAAYREKDRDFARTLLAENLVKPRVLAQRVKLLDIEEPLRERLVQWVRTTAKQLKSGR